MNHTPSQTTVYYTSQYKAFKFMPGNRIINDRKIKKIINDIDDGLNMLRYCPIVVLEDMTIIDGQHRFQVCKILKQPVFYIVAKPISLYDVARINSRTERWKPADFLRCYAEVGNKHYKLLQQFMADYQGMPVSSAIYLLYVGLQGDRSAQMMRRFEQGRFEVRDYDDACTIANAAALFQRDDFSAHFSASFLKAIRTILIAAKCNMEVMMSKYERASHLLTPLSNHKAYLSALEDVYNYQNSKRNTIY